MPQQALPLRHENKMAPRMLRGEVLKKYDRETIGKQKVKTGNNR